MKPPWRRPFQVIAIAAQSLCLMMGCEKPPGNPPTESSTQSNSFATVTDLPPISRSGSPRAEGDFAGECLQAFRFPDGHLQHPTFQAADLVACSLRNSIITGADLRQSRWLRGDLADCVFLASDWEDSLVLDTALDGAHFRRGDFEDARFLRASFRHADLGDIQLEGSLFWECDFSEARFENVSWAGACFRGCDFTRADLSGIRDWRDVADLAQCTFNRVLNPPPGFLEFATEQHDALTLVEAD